MDIEFLIPSQSVIRSLTAGSIIYIRCMGSLHQLEFINLQVFVLLFRDHDGLLMDVVARQEAGNHIDLYFGN